MSGSRQRHAVRKSGTIGESSKEGENEEGVVLGGAVEGDGVGVGFALKMNVEDVFDCGEGVDAGFGAIRRGSFARVAEYDGECADARSIGNVSAISTTVLNESMNGSHAVSDPIPPPAPITTRIISPPIFSNASPAYVLVLAWSCLGICFWYLVNVSSHFVMALDMSR